MVDRARAPDRAHNPTLAITDEDAFVEQALAGLGPQPPNPMLRAGVGSKLAWVADRDREVVFIGPPGGRRSG